MFRMTIPTSPFYKGLQRFRYRTTVAAVRYDMLVCEEEGERKRGGKERERKEKREKERGEITTMH